LAAKEERMMKKTGAVWVAFGVAITLLGFWGAGARAQEILVDASAESAEVAAPTEEQVAPLEEEAPVRLSPAVRLEQLQTADLVALRAARAEAMKAAQYYSEKIPEYRRRAQQAYEEARLNSPEAQAMRKQILDLETALREYLTHLPEVAQYEEAIRQAEQDMLAELQLRTSLGVLIARRGGRSDGEEADEEDEAVE
jgi:hypothetical protein